MYIFYICSSIFVIYCFSYCFSKKKINKFDYKEDKIFELKNILFYKNNKLIKNKIYNKIYENSKNLEFNLLSYDYFIVEYNVNNKPYKYISNSQSIIFPFYQNNSISIKNYVYINNIVNAKLIISKNSKFEEFNIEKYLITFVGPNYNFYSDLNFKIKTDLIVNYILNNNLCITDYESNLNYQLKLYDNFKKEYIMNKYLEWNPNLQL
tara:strand:+ start:2958 stop:3581 length:624 start_codon:yes stop_codon:yes gene_type:complete